jgi:hypothetical protein
MPSITIQNNSTNMMTLSEAATTAKDVQVKITEANPGHLFTAMLTFPQGYELPQGEQAFFTVKSSNPQFSVIKVPITQMQRPPATTPIATPFKTTSGLHVAPSQVAGGNPKVDPPLQPLPIKGQ